MITKEDAIKAIKKVCMYDGETPQMIWSTDAMDAVRGLPDQSGWISVKDRLPENDHTVLVTRKIGKRAYVEVANYFPESGEWDDPMSEYLIGKALPSVTVTHWMPMPEPPEG